MAMVIIRFLNIFYTTPGTEHISKNITIKYISETPIIIVISMPKLFAAELKSPPVLESDNGSTHPATNLNDSCKMPTKIIGDNTVINIKITPLNPTAFLIILAPTLATSNPSLMYPPSMGI